MEKGSRLECKWLVWLTGPLKAVADRMRQGDEMAGDGTAGQQSNRGNPFQIHARLLRCSLQPMGIEIRGGGGDRFSFSPVKMVCKFFFFFVDNLNIEVLSNFRD